MRLTVLSLLLGVLSSANSGCCPDYYVPYGPYGECVDAYPESGPGSYASRRQARLTRRANRLLERANSPYGPNSPSFGQFSPGCGFPDSCGCGCCDGMCGQACFDGGDACCGMGMSGCSGGMAMGEIPCADGSMMGGGAMSGPYASSGFCPDCQQQMMPAQQQMMPAQPQMMPTQQQMMPARPPIEPTPSPVTRPSSPSATRSSEYFSPPIPTSSAPVSVDQMQYVTPQQVVAPY